MTEQNKTNTQNAPTVAVSTVKSGGLGTLGDALGASLRNVPTSAQATATQGIKLSDIGAATAPRPLPQPEVVVVVPPVAPAAPAVDANAALMAELERLKAENVALAAAAAAKKSAPGMTVKLSDKTPGVICVYGLGRFPISLYEGQWRKLAEGMDGILKFIDAHKHLLPSETETKANLEKRKAAAAAASASATTEG